MPKINIKKSKAEKNLTQKRKTKIRIRVLDDTRILGIILDRYEMITLHIVPLDDTK